MRHIALLAGVFVLGLLPTEGITAPMEELRPSSRPEVREEAEAPLRFFPQQEETELPLESPLEDLTPNPILLDTTPQPEVPHMKFTPQPHNKTTTGGGSGGGAIPLETQMQGLCRVRKPIDLNNEAITKACEALGCSKKHPTQPCRKGK